MASESRRLFCLSAESLAGRLVNGCAAWDQFTHHVFVERLAAGDLPAHCFRYYLIQDYRFLIHFSRAWALAAYKSSTIDDIRECAATVHNLINDEIRLHVNYCADFGLDEASMAATPEHPANMAYTRFVMETGHAGDLLDLLAALAPCVVGYGEIGARLQQNARHNNNTYAAWITTYGGAEYRLVVTRASEQLDRVAKSRLGDLWSSPRLVQLQQTFDTATALEIAFWQMGLDARP